MAQSKKGHNSLAFFRIYSKVNQVIYSSLPIYFIKFQGTSFSSFWDILLKREYVQIYKGPKLVFQ